jgi:hypothetical protein
MWVLLLAIHFGPTNGGSMAMTSPEFSSQQKCEAAKAAAEKSSDAASQVWAVCVAK